MDYLSFSVMMIALSQLMVLVGLCLIYSRGRNSPLAGAGLIVISTIPLFALIDLKELKMFIFFISTNLWVFAILVALKVITKEEGLWNQ